MSIGDLAALRHQTLKFVTDIHLRYMAEFNQLGFDLYKVFMEEVLENIL